MSTLRALPPCGVRRDSEEVTVCSTKFGAQQAQVNFLEECVKWETCIEETKYFYYINMPYSIAYNPSGMIILRFEGLMTLQVVLDATVEAVQVAKEQGCFR